MAASVGRSPTDQPHLRPTAAPVPSASTRAIRAGSSSAAYLPVTVPENCCSTSYGERPPAVHRS